MAVKELNEIYGEVGRNLDNQMDENVLIPGETGTKTFGAFKFFSGIKKFLEGSAKKIISKRQFLTSCVSFFQIPSS